MQALAPAFIARAIWLWIALGILGLAFMAFCPQQYHRPFSDFMAGLLAGLAVVACFVRIPKSRPSA